MLGVTTLNLPVIASPQEVCVITSAGDVVCGKLFPPPIQTSIKPLNTLGLYLVSTTLIYSDGDRLSADFRIYCPTSTIRPTNYMLVDGTGTVKKQGKWWEPAFTPRYDSEFKLIKKVCEN